jgi:hypothetical protein
MTKSKKLALPAKVQAPADPAVSHVLNGDTQGQVTRVESEQADDRAQAYALRVWEGQSESLGRATRVERIKAALDGQGLSFDGVKLPGASADDEDWTAEDEQPVTWKKPSE